MFITQSSKKYYRLSIGFLRNLTCYDRDISEQRQRLNPVIDFDDWCVSELKSLGIKEYYLKLTNGVEKSMIMFEPHNFPNVYHLNLAESYFIRFKDRRDERLRSIFPRRCIQELYSEFRETCAREIVSELLTRLTEMPCPVSKLMKNFLNFARISRCIRKEEVNNVTKSCLKAMYRQKEFLSDGSLTVQILRTFCVFQQHKQNLVLGDYSYDLIDYVLRCGTAAKFDMERYFLYDNRGEHTYFCPVTACIISSQQDFRKLWILLQHGFELQALDLSLMKFIYVFVGVSDHLRANGMGIADTELRIGDRRQYILLLFLFMVFSGSTHGHQAWTVCSKLLFNSIPDAYICELEVCSFLKMPYLSDNCESILSVCTTFKGSYTASRTPRTLKHLSRCIVRKVLRNNFQLPNGIDALFLPSTLASYLRFLED